jgi:ribulose-phosphate 3-epimerase
MTVEPGFGGQKFMNDQLAKIREAAEFRRSMGTSVWLQVDGGIDDDTISQAADAGADTFVAGSAVFGKESPQLAIDTLRSIAEDHHHPKEHNGKA